MGIIRKDNMNLVSNVHYVMLQPQTSDPDELAYFKCTYHDCNEVLPANKLFSHAANKHGITAVTTDTQSWMGGFESANTEKPPRELHFSLVGPAIDGRYAQYQCGLCLEKVTQDRTGDHAFQRHRRHDYTFDENITPRVRRLWLR